MAQKPAAVKPAASNEKPSDPFAGKAGRVIHDARGNAVWDWVKETSRIAIDSTSRLLKRLEVPELKVEDTQPNAELSLESDRDAGGGYDPYGGSKSGKAPASRSGGASGFNASRSSYTPSSGSSGTRGGVADPRVGAKGSANIGGGYDPYGKGVSKPSGRKP